MAMKQFPGLEEDVARALGNIKKLYEDAETTLEGKKYADVMKFAFDEVAKGNSPEILVPVMRKGVESNEFIKFLEVKFGKHMVDKTNPQSVAGNETYLLINGTSFVFVMRLGDYPKSKSIRLVKVTNQDFFKNLIEIDR